MPKFRKKPVVIEAVQWWKVGDHSAVRHRPAQVVFSPNREHYYVDSADPECRATQWLPVDTTRPSAMSLPFAFYEVRAGAREPLGAHPKLVRAFAIVHGWTRDPRDFGVIDTLEGPHIVTPGDWIITGVKGEHYPCKPDIFAETYEPAE